MAPTWNEKLDLPDRSYSVSDIQNYFKYIMKKRETVTGNPPIRIYVNEIGNRVTFRIKTGNYIEILTSETMKLLGSTKNKIINGKNVGLSEITKVVSINS